MNCPFCDIVAGVAPASRVYEDADIVAFMALRPTAPGECLVIPKAHIDHFVDIPDELAARIMVVAQQISRRLRSEFRPERVGFLVHGYGVAHAHLIIVPQTGPHHLTSDRFARVDNGRVTFSMSLPMVARSQLDEQARRLAPLADGRPDVSSKERPGSE
ncbi:MAG: HIT family protein [Gemmatimonadaceae bacterium]